MWRWKALIEVLKWAWYCMSPLREWRWLKSSPTFGTKSGLDLVSPVANCKQEGRIDEGINALLRLNHGLDRLKWLLRESRRHNQQIPQRNLERELSASGQRGLPNLFHHLRVHSLYTGFLQDRKSVQHAWNMCCLKWQAPGSCSTQLSWSTRAAAVSDWRHGRLIIVVDSREIIHLGSTW